ncbi:MAG TPA: malonyl CoA-acyl carrier protein transacylase, partial [Alphaproteobacteria bacterium]|nr:malonyl CoA-acyl carrier protein transacylase [Alphaproteobacteria bacterium]
GGRGPARAIMLPVSAPFHCALMQPAADAMAEALAKVAMEAPIVPLVANVTASAVSDVLAVRNLLVAQVTARVRWRECVLAMQKDGVDCLVEIGSGKVLSGLTRRIARELNAVSIQSPADIEAFLKTV